MQFHDMVGNEERLLSFTALYCALLYIEYFAYYLYTVNHKKRDILFLTITLANLNRFS